MEHGVTNRYLVEFANGSTRVCDSLEVLTVRNAVSITQITSISTQARHEASYEEQREQERRHGD